MELLNPIDLAEALVDYEQVLPAQMGTYTFNTGKRTDSDVDAGDAVTAGWDARPMMGTYTGNTGKRTDSDVDAGDAVTAGWDPRSPKGTDTFNGGRPSDRD